jgi:hypothetical protein
MKYPYLITLIILAFSNCKEASKPTSKSSEPPKSIITDSSYAAVKSTWDTIIVAIQKHDLIKFESLSLDSINACNKRMNSSYFINKCAHEVVNDLLLTRAKDAINIDVNNLEVISSFYSSTFLSHLKSYESTFFIKRIQVDLMDTEPYVVAFDFIETTQGYKFFSCDVYGGPDCCR